MLTLAYQLSFNTPAFLGNADQRAQWRTPPIKALIRQWWRVTKKARTASDTTAMRYAEGMQFGNAWLAEEGPPQKNLHRKSELLIRLSSHALGKLSTDSWQRLQFEAVPTSRETRLRADVYTGYGPVLSEKAIQGVRRVVIARGAIEEGQPVQLRLGMRHPLQGLDDSLQLMHCFGALGSRSRNAWGSLHFDPDNEAARRLGLGNALELAQKYGRPWKDCYQLDWPHAFGNDKDGPLIWVSEDLDNWRAAIGRLARVRVAARLAAKRVEDRCGAAGSLHYLGYPAGTGKSNPWELPRRTRSSSEPRLASPLRFKVVRNGSKVRALVFHMPSCLPKVFLDAIGESEAAWLADSRNWHRAWQEIHEMLDRNQDPMNLGKSLGLRRLGAPA